MKSPRQGKPPKERRGYGKQKPSCGTLSGRVVYSRNADGQVAGASSNGERSIIDEGTYSGANVPCADIEI
jgi:hypothetical protein